MCVCVREVCVQIWLCGTGTCARPLAPVRCPNFSYTAKVDLRQVLRDVLACVTGMRAGACGLGGVQTGAHSSSLTW